MTRKLYDTNSAAAADNQLYICGNFHDTPQMALQLYVLHTTAASPACKRPFFDLAVRVTIQLAVSRPVCLGFKPSWAHNQTIYVLDDDYGNTVMVRACMCVCVCVHARLPDGMVGMAIFKNHSLCVCSTYL